MPSEFSYLLIRYCKNSGEGGYIIAVDILSGMCVGASRNCLEVIKHTGIPYHETPDRQ